MKPSKPLLIQIGALLSAVIAVFLMFFTETRIIGVVLLTLSVITYIVVQTRKQTNWEVRDIEVDYENDPYAKGYKDGLLHLPSDKSVPEVQRKQYQSGYEAGMFHSRPDDPHNL